MLNSFNCLYCYLWVKVAQFGQEEVGIVLMTASEPSVIWLFELDKKHVDSVLTAPGTFLVLGENSKTYIIKHND